MKGDYVEITVAFGGSISSARIAATKAGRTVKWLARTKGSVRWIVVTEVTRTGRESGDVLQARADAVLTLREHHVDVAEQTSIRRKAKKADESQLWDALDVAPTLVLDTSSSVPSGVAGSRP